MYDALLEKVKRIKPSAVSNTDILGFFEEAVAKACPDRNEYASGAYLDDVLLFYALAMVALYSGDLAEYSNYFVLYNNAATEFRRRSFDQIPPDERGSHYTNLW